jgi:hypothetical protein
MTKEEFIARAIKEHRQRFGLQDEELGSLLHTLEAAYQLGQQHLTDLYAEIYGPVVAGRVRPKIDPRRRPAPQDWTGILTKGEQEERLAGEWRKTLGNGAAHFG